MKKPAGSDPAGEQPQPTQEGAMATNLSIPDREARAATIRGLRDLAAYLERHQEIPLPAYIEVSYHAPQDDRAEVDRIADALDRLTKETSDGEHYEVSKPFAGRVSYRAVTVSSACMARHYAEASYRGCVVPA